MPAPRDSAAARRKLRSSLLRDAVTRDLERAASAPTTPLDPADVFANPFLAYRPIDYSALRRLLSSLNQGRLPDPIVVWRVTGHPPRWVILHRQLTWHAARAAALPALPARVLVFRSQDAAERFALAIAIRDRQLSPSQEGHAYRRLLELGLSRDDAAAVTGFSRVHLTYALQLLDLPAGVIRLVDLGALKPKPARHLHRFAPYPRTLTRIAAHIVLRKLSPAQLASLRPEDPASLHAAGIVLNGGENPESTVAALERRWSHKHAAQALADEIDSWTTIGAITPETAAAVATDLVLRAGPAPTVAAVTRQLPHRAAQAASLADAAPHHPTAALWSPFLLELARENPLLPLKIAFEAHRLHALTAPTTPAP